MVKLVESLLWVQSIQHWESRLEGHALLCALLPVRFGCKHLVEDVQDDFGKHTVATRCIAQLLASHCTHQ